MVSGAHFETESQRTAEDTGGRLSPAVRVGTHSEPQRGHEDDFKMTTSDIRQMQKALSELPLSV